MKYELIPKPQFIEATQWNGPDDCRDGIYMIGPGHVLPEYSECGSCGYELKEHGRIGKQSLGEFICPGDYIITENEVATVMPEYEFESYYRAVT